MAEDTRRFDVASWDPALLVTPTSTVVLLALLSHYIFSRYEPWPQHLVVPALTGVIFTLHHEYVRFDGQVCAALCSAVSLVSLYLAVVFASIAVYRLAYHRLRRFPGPARLALSKWAMLLDDVHGQRYRRIHALHARFGTVVRTGPREISINDASVIPAVYGAQSACIKGPWYRGIAGDRPVHEQSLYDTRCKHTHAHRRKAWNAALAHQSRSAHVCAIHTLVGKTIKQLQARTDTMLDLSEWCAILSFDVMCEIGFSRRLNLIERGKRSRELTQLQQAVAHAQVIGNLPYLSKALDWLPQSIHTFKTWVRETISERTKTMSGEVDFFAEKPSPAPPVGTPDLEDASSMPPTPGPTRRAHDVMAHLLEQQQQNVADGIGSTVSIEKQIVAEGMLLAVGGSDTTSAALTMAFYLLTKHAGVAEQVRAEVNGVLSNESHGDDAASALRLADALKDECPVLNAVIKETLRLYPPGLSGLQRQTPSEGLALCVDEGKPLYVPGNVVVTVPTWTIQRDERNFSPAPNVFRPERWLRPECETNMNATGAFVPFGYGPTSCAGREVAWVEMRLFVAKVLDAFQMSFTDDFDERLFLEGVRDQFTLHTVVPLRLRLTSRAGGDVDTASS